jgi:hypothetical protein
LQHVRLNLDTEEPLTVSPEAQEVETNYAELWSPKR